MKSLHFIALRLAALPEDDRRWLLSRLTPAERSRIQPALEEALQLSPGDLMKALDDKPAAEPSAVASHSTERPKRMVLYAADARRLIPLLAPLPLACTALLLDKARWPSSDALTGALTADERRNMPKALEACRDRISERFEALLLDRIDAALRRDASPAADRFERLLQA